MDVWERIKDNYRQKRARTCGICGKQILGSFDAHIKTHTGENRVVSTSLGLTRRTNTIYLARIQDQGRLEEHEPADIQRVRVFSQSYPSSVRHFGGIFERGPISRKGPQNGMTRYFDKSGRLRQKYRWIIDGTKTAAAAACSRSSARPTRSCNVRPPPPLVNTNWWPQASTEPTQFTAVRANLFTPKKWPAWKQETDPTSIDYYLQQCDYCSKKMCACVDDVVRQDVPAIVAVAAMGEGVEATAVYDEGVVMGEVHGEIVPPNTYSDGWAADMYRTDLSGAERRVYVCQIYPRYVGNWTRKINHSCEANAEFAYMRLSGHWRMVVVAKRRVRPGDAITVHYGDTYWQGKETRCQCRSARCVSRSTATIGGTWTIEDVMNGIPP